MRALQPFAPLTFPIALRLGALPLPLCGRGQRARRSAFGFGRDFQIVARDVGQHAGLGDFLRQLPVHGGTERRAQRRIAVEDRMQGL